MMDAADVGNGRVPPSNREAERKILGSVLLDNAVLETVMTVVDPSDFFFEGNRVIYEAMARVAKGGAPIDHVTLGHEMMKSGSLAKIGGAGELLDLADNISAAANAEHYSRIVRELSGVRNVIHAARVVADVGFSSGDAQFVTEALEGLATATRDLEKSNMPMSLLGMGDHVIEAYSKVASGYRGVPLPWKSLDDMTAGLWPKTLTMFVARPGIGKCLHGSTLTYIKKTGQYKTIEQVVKDKDDVLTRKADGSIVGVTPDAWLDMGTKECMKVRFHSGREMSQTPEHPVMTVDGWKRTDELKIGDYAEAVGIVPEPEMAIKVDDNESMLIAAMLADGGVTQDQPTFTKRDDAIVGFVRVAVSQHDCYLVQMTNGKEDGRYRVNGSVKFWKKWDSWGCCRSLSKNKVIPDRVFQYDNESLAKFLGMFWSCDGSFPVSRNGFCNAEISLAAKEMVEQLQRLFLRFGIHGRVRHKKAKCQTGVFDCWVYRVYSTSHERFKTLIPIVGEKAEKVLLLEDASNPNVDNIPITPKLKAELLHIVEGFHDKGRVRRYEQMSRELGMTTRISANKLYRRDTVSRRIFRAFIDAFGAKHLEHLLVNHWDRVESIEDDGVQRVFDLTVMDGHAYVANDMVVHNTFVAIIVARHAWLCGKRVLLVSPEMSKEEIAERFFVIHSCVSYKRLISGTLSDFELPQLKKTVSNLSAVASHPAENLWIMDDEDDISPSGIDAAIRATDAEAGVIDSVYDLHIKGDRRERTIAGVEWLRRSCKRGNYAAVGYSQQNRAAELSEKKGGGARLGTIANADEVGQDAHTVIALEQSKDDKDDGILKMKPLKIRRGQFKRDAISIRWDFDKMVYDEMPEEEDDYRDEISSF